MYLESFWEKFASLSSQTEASLTIDQVVYVKLRFRFFFIDRYLLPELFTPRELENTPFFYMDRESKVPGNLVKHLQNMLKDNLTIAL